MALALEGVRTWFTNTARLDMRTADVAALANGGILVAFGGSSGQSAAIYTALLDTATDTLGAVSTQVIARTGGFASTLRRIEIDAARGDDAVITTHWFNANINNDGNFALATQRYDGAAPRGAPRPVNPDGPGENTYDIFSTVVLGNGRTLTFFTEPGVGQFGANLSNGIRMSTFNANGALVGDPVQVVGERVINTLLGLESNPEHPSAVLMGNGNIGLLYKESTNTGSPTVKFQVLTPAGAAVGDPVTLAGPGLVSPTGILPKVIVLDNGRMVAVWFDSLTNGYLGQILSKAGAPIGETFAPTTTGNQAFMAFDIVALGNGNFAVAFSDTTLGMSFGQIFDDNGKVLSNPFPLLDTVDGFSALGLQIGVVAQGDDLLAYALGTRGDSLVQQLDGQLFDGDGSLGRTVTGRNSNSTIDGGALDDRLDGAGGNDLLRGAGGQDVLIGGRGRDRLEGGAGTDQLFGDDGNDRLFGGDGTDILRGGAGNDQLNGGAGRDFLLGGAGRDTLTGGAGADVFMFNSPLEGVDVITDFSRAEGDKLRTPVTSFLPVTVTSGAEVDPAAFGFFFNTTTGMLSFDPDGAGSRERVNLVELRGVTTLALEDFIYI
jgi:Ca2+-binding RTX toxin-like protein